MDILGGYIISNVKYLFLIVLVFSDFVELREKKYYTFGDKFYSPPFVDVIT